MSEKELTVPKEPNLQTFMRAGMKERNNMEE